MQLTFKSASCVAWLSIVCVACSTPRATPDASGEQGTKDDRVVQPLGEKSQPKPEVAESFVVQGVRTVDAGEAVDGQALFALWNVTSGSPDYVYMFGQGQASGDRFTMKFEGPPPAAAINSYGVGVAVIGGLAKGSEPVAQGRCDTQCIAWKSEQAKPGVPLATAFTDHYAVLWVDPSADLSDLKLPDWMREAPKGYSCVRGVPAKNEGFDAFEQVDCGQVELRVDVEFEFVNWT